MGPNPPGFQSRHLLRPDSPMDPASTPFRSWSPSGCSRTTRTEVQKLTTGCAVRCRGEIVESRGKGQSLEMKADARSRWSGWIEDPDTYPAPTEAPLLRVPARGRTPSPENEHLRCGSDESDTVWPWRHTASCTRTVFSGYTPPSSPPTTVRVPVRCFACRRWIS